MIRRKLLTSSRNLAVSGPGETKFSAERSKKIKAAAEAKAKEAILAQDDVVLASNEAAPIKLICKSAFDM